MSAFICNQGHINAIVKFLCSTRDDLYIYMPELKKSLTYSPHVIDDMNLVGQILTDANYKSVNYRYSENDEPEQFEFKIMSRNYSPVQILKALDCYDYQSCEFEGYYDSLAYKIITAIRQRAIDALPGYDEAQWEIREKAIIN